MHDDYFEYPATASEAVRHLDKIYGFTQERLLDMGFSPEAIIIAEHMFDLYRVYGKENVVIHGISKVQGSYTLDYNVRN